jgi:GDP/UDP-N,N'-diacetylbacillosamine 2-epimerase (hydrolysing)
MKESLRRICFVTGTRAEFGLMDSTLRAINAHRGLKLQIIATGMHLDSLHGDGIATIGKQGWRVDATVAWPAESGKRFTQRAEHTGLAMAGMARSFAKLKSDIVLVVGDRVEAFAAAGAAHLSGCILAHIHGGDRAAGQSDDCLRHAVTKLAHLHFPATKQSAERLSKLGEDPWRIRRCGSPGVDGIFNAAAEWLELGGEFPGLARRRFALVVHHPIESDEHIEATRMRELLDAVMRSKVDRIVVIHPNNDPGSRGIQRVLDEQGSDVRLLIRRDVPRNLFLGLMRDCACLIGNSSSGIIEAGSFGTPVVDIGPRQLGRERGPNVLHCEYGRKAITAALRKLWDGSRFIRLRGSNAYGTSGAGVRIASELAKLKIDAKLRRKLIAY